MPETVANHFQVLRPYVTWVYITIMLIPTALVALDSEGVVGFFAFIVICLGGTISGYIGIKRNAPSSLLPWKILIACPILGGAGSVLRAFFQNTSDPLLQVLPDLLTIPGYMCFGAAMILFLRARRKAHPDIFVDAGLLGVSTFLALAIFLTLPVLESDAPLASKFINATYPMISVGLLFLGALLLLTQTAKMTSYRLLMGAIVVVVVGDIIFAMDVIGQNPLPMVIPTVTYCLLYILASAAILHPSMEILTRGTDVRSMQQSTRFVPLMVGLAAPIVLAVVHPLPSSMDRIVLAVGLTVLAGLILLRISRAIREHSESAAKLEVQATHDALTGLPNRMLLQRLLDARLIEARVTGKTIGVAFLDLDRFKAVNDNWGHAVGDQLLLAVSDRLSSICPEGGVASRISGDEFVLIHPDVDGERGAETWGSQILSALSSPVKLPSVQQMQISSSVGISYADPSRPSVQADELIQEADTAMYRAKHSHRGSVVVYNDALGFEVQERISIERDLREALERDEVSLHYQPIVALGDGHVTGFEALMRWSHPKRGMVPPDLFISIAEDTQLVVKLGQWALRESISQLGEWQSFQRGDVPRLTMSVNLSARQLRDPELLQVVKESIDAAGVDPGDVWLEITESATFEDEETARAVLTELEAMGVHLSADDFGTGYSSLVYLQRYPIHQVKVDRSFVSDMDTNPDAKTIIAGVLSLAAALNLSTVAEGIETAVQCDTLRRMGFTKAQGYLFSKPLDADSAGALVVRGVSLLPERSIVNQEVSR